MTNPLLSFLSGVKPTEQPGVYAGEPAVGAGRGMFGGMAVGQAVTAVTRDVPEGRRLHSMHLYYVRPSNGDVPIRYDVDTIRDGRAFSARRFRASQEDKTTLEGACSFTTDTDGYEYDQPHTSQLPARVPSGAGFAPDGLEAVHVGPTEQTADGIYESTSRKWFRLAGAISDDVHLHTAVMGFASDWTDIGARPRRLYWNDGDEYGIASLDHAVWFHRPPRVDEWHLSDMHALVNFGGRSHVRITIRDEQGRVVCSAAQELLVKVLPEQPTATR